MNGNTHLHLMCCNPSLEREQTSYALYCFLIYGCLPRAGALMLEEMFYSERCLLLNAFSDSLHLLNTTLENLVSSQKRNCEASTIGAVYIFDYVAEPSSNGGLELPWF